MGEVTDFEGTSSFAENLNQPKFKKEAKSLEGRNRIFGI